MALLAPTPDAEARDSIKKKHLLRKAKAYHFAGDYEHVLATVQSDTQAFEDEEALVDCAHTYANAMVQITDLSRARIATVLDLPRYKPNL